MSQPTNPTTRAPFPLGLWLGYIAWRAGSVIPSMICHATVNGSALALGRLGIGFEPGQASPAAWATLVSALLACTVAAVLGVRRLERAARTGSNGDSCSPTISI